MTRPKPSPVERTHPRPAVPGIGGSMNGLIPINLAPTPGGRVLITVAWNPATRVGAPVIVSPR